MVSGPGGDTVSPVLPLTAPCVAEMVVVPELAADASPPLLMVATAVFVDAHVTWPVRSCVVASEYVPVAAYCRVSPVVTVAFAGVTVIDVSVGAATVTVIAAETAPMLALSSVARARSVAGPLPLGTQV